MKNDQKYNSILTVICCITKYALFIFTQNDITAADFVKLFFEHVECCFDSSRNIVTDRNSCIISDFWQESKALNQVIENCLQAYTSEDQTV